MEANLKRDRSSRPQRDQRANLPALWRSSANFSRPYPRPTANRSVCDPGGAGDGRADFDEVGSQRGTDHCQPFSDCPFPNPPGSFHCNGLSSFQKPLRTVCKRITHQQPLSFCTPCHPFPCVPLSGTPWRGVTPASTTMALYPFRSRREGYPAFSRIRRASAF